MPTNDADTRSPREDQPRLTPQNLFQAYAELLKAMLGNLFLVNAGSATALIAFAGNARNDPGTGQRPILDPLDLKIAIIWLGLGAFAAIVATGLAALAENRNAFALNRTPPRAPKAGIGFVAFAVVLFGVFCFLKACLTAAGMTFGDALHLLNPFPNLR